MLKEMSGRANLITFHFRPMMDDNNYDFSFSGLKTSMINYIRNMVQIIITNSILSSFQEAAFSVLFNKYAGSQEQQDFKVWLAVGLHQMAV